MNEKINNCLEGSLWQNIRLIFMCIFGIGSLGCLIQSAVWFFRISPFFSYSSGSPKLLYGFLLANWVIPIISMVLFGIITYRSSKNQNQIEMKILSSAAFLLLVSSAAVTIGCVFLSTKSRCLTTIASFYDGIPKWSKEQDLRWRTYWTKLTQSILDDEKEEFILKWNLSRCEKPGLVMIILFSFLAVSMFMVVTEYVLKFFGDKKRDYNNLLTEHTNADSSNVTQI